MDGTASNQATKKDSQYIIIPGKRPSSKARSCEIVDTFYVMYNDPEKGKPVGIGGPRDTIDLVLEQINQHSFLVLR